MEANDFDTFEVEVVTGDEIVISEAEFDRMLRDAYWRGFSDKLIAIFRQAVKEKLALHTIHRR